jgi:hypothetical protein
MSNTSIKPSIREWFPRLLSGQPHQIIGGADNPYMVRWYVIPRNPVVNVYVHKFLRSDDDRALHDHPWWFVSLMLRGRYDEVTESGVKRRRAGSIAYRPAEWRHRVRLLRVRGPRLHPDMTPSTWEEPCWTLIVTGPRRRTWGFWCKNTLLTISGRHVPSERFIPWTEFGDAGCGEQ